MEGRRAVATARRDSRPPTPASRRRSAVPKARTRPFSAQAAMDGGCCITPPATHARALLYTYIRTSACLVARISGDLYLAPQAKTAAHSAGGRETRARDAELSRGGGGGGRTPGAQAPYVSPKKKTAEIAVKSFRPIRKGRRRVWSTSGSVLAARHRNARDDEHRNRCRAG